MKLEIKNLTKKYGNKVVINQINLELKEGVYGLLGPNGAGKTTLMRMIADVLKPTEGEILVEGINKNKLAADYRDLLGYLPQDIGYYDNFTAQRFLEYVSALKGIDRRKAKKKICELLEIVRLTEYKDKKIGRFSGGMKQRLGIAQSLLNNPKILILDEPTAGLDPNERIRFKNVISDISKDRVVILSTHIVSDIEFIANEILIIKEGRLLQRAKPLELTCKLSGKVWALEVTESELHDINSKYKVANICRENNSITVRIVGDKKPNEYAKDEKPNLQDVFLYYFNEKVQDVC
ncbi:ABC transporter ATP-binding protein [Clostridium lundense]|uniref:ABC transporter ATP-binding protein n=1 Tax=Clostridium lundense TaxID=319475 RepID=UPI0004863870|nr:ABC transporter ATP-binding protein [Clostridium lundense]